MLIIFACMFSIIIIFYVQIFILNLSQLTKNKLENTQDNLETSLNRSCLFIGNWVVYYLPYKYLSSCLSPVWGKLIRPLHFEGIWITNKITKQRCIKRRLHRFSTRSVFPVFCSEQNWKPNRKPNKKKHYAYRTERKPRKPKPSLTEPPKIR